MKFRTALVLGFVALSALACGGTGSTSGGIDISGMPTVPLSDPWTGMNLPVGDGSVITSDGTILTVMYQGGTVAELTGKYDEAIKAGGWTESFKSDEGGVVTISYSKDGGMLTMSGVEAMGTVTVSMSKM